MLDWGLVVVCLFVNFTYCGLQRQLSARELTSKVVRERRELTLPAEPAQAK